MEVICLETAAFYELVEKVTQHLIAAYSDQPPKWIATEKAMEMLSITSKTTMQVFRDEGKIRFSQPAKKIILYDRDSINEFLESHAKEVFRRKGKSS